MGRDWGVVIPAGGLVKDPLASALGTPRKALALIGGEACLSRTLDAVRQAGFDRIAVVSGEDVRPFATGAVFVPEGAGQMENALAGVEALPGCDSILFLPADTPFLNAGAIRHFVDGVERQLAGAGGKWFSAGLCPYGEFLKVLPGFEHPHIRLADGDFMSGAFFATSREGFLDAVEQFKGFSKSRKSQVGMLLRIGLWPMAKYLLHRMTLEEGIRVLSKVFGGKGVVVPDCDPWAMADIDTVDEYRRLATESGPGSST